MWSGSPLSFSKSRIGAVMEALASRLGSAAGRGLGPIELPLAPLVLGSDLGPRWREHAVEPAQHGHWQHDPFVLRRSIGAAQQVGDLPDQVRKVAMVGHRLTLPALGIIAKWTTAFGRNETV